VNKHAPKLDKVILYYIFTPIADPEAMLLWQKNLCQSLNLKGRILISKHGINGTLGGEMADVKKYVRETRRYPGFKKITFKWSDGTGNEFPRLRVVVKDELVAFGNPDEIEVDENGVIGGGIHLRPEQVEELVKERGDDVVFFDGLVFDLASCLGRLQRGVQAPGPLLLKGHGVNAGHLELGLRQADARCECGQRGRHDHRVAAVQNFLQHRYSHWFTRQKGTLQPDGGHRVA